MAVHEPINFLKMNGLGNDFVVIDARARKVAIDDAVAGRIADRNKGIGCDQLILLEPSGAADAFMRIRNADGGEVDACGNAARCVAWLLHRQTGKANPVIETNVGILGTLVHEDGSVTVDMGAPRLRWDEIPLAEEFHDTTGIELQLGPIDDPILHTPSVVNIGNPHCIFWVDQIGAYNLSKIGSVLENHPIFPERANISLAQITSRESITLKVWERGVGLTKACGTAACATLVAAVRKGFTEARATVTLPGGPLIVHWQEDGHVHMTGPSVLEYEGQFDPVSYGLATG